MAGHMVDGLELEERMLLERARRLNETVCECGHVEGQYAIRVVNGVAYLALTGPVLEPVGVFDAVRGACSMGCDCSWRGRYTAQGMILD